MNPGVGEGWGFHLCLALPPAMPAPTQPSISWGGCVLLSLLGAQSLCHPRSGSRRPALTPSAGRSLSVQRDRSCSITSLIKALTRFFIHLLSRYPLTNPHSGTGSELGSRDREEGVGRAQTPSNSTSCDRSPCSLPSGHEGPGPCQLGATAAEPGLQSLANTGLGPSGLPGTGGERGTDGASRLQACGPRTHCGHICPPSRTGLLRLHGRVVLPTPTPGLPGHESRQGDGRGQRKPQPCGWGRGGPRRGHCPTSPGAGGSSGARTKG